MRFKLLTLSGALLIAGCVSVGGGRGGNGGGSNPDGGGGGGGTVPNRDPTQQQPAVDQRTLPGYEPGAGANLGNSNTIANALPNIPSSPMCPGGGGGGMACQPQMVHDYTELVVKLKAPTNVHSFTFQFHFFSAEYP